MPLVCSAKMCTFMLYVLIPASLFSTVMSRTLKTVHSTYGYESVMNQEATEEEFTPPKARMVDSFAGEIGPEYSYAAQDTERDAGLEETNEGVITMETDMQTIYNRSDLEGEEGGVHEGGRYGRKLHILNDEM